MTMPGCEHCFCQPGPHINGVAHQQCCKCNDRRALGPILGPAVATSSSVRHDPTVPFTLTADGWATGMSIPSPNVRPLPFEIVWKGA